jgi:alpha-tubulin suppressor-like RCC1 family protein
MIVGLRSIMVSACLAAGAAAGVAHAQGQVAGWGDNSAGQFGPPSRSLLRVERVAVGGYHTLALLSDGSVRCFGSNVYGQQNVPFDLPPVARIFAGSDHNVVLLADGTVRAWGDDSFGQCQVPATLGSVRTLACGEFHTVAVRADGSVVGWGENASGQCNAPSGLSSPVAVAGGSFHSMAIRADGTVACWGSNANGQCAVPAQVAGATAIAAGRHHSVALLAGGVVRCWGASGGGGINVGQATVPAGLAPVSSVDAGDFHTVVRMADGTVRCWGAGSGGNASGQPNFAQSTVPAGLGAVRDAQAGAFHSLALMNDGTLRCWGATRDDQCDLPGSLGALTQVSAGAFFAVGRAADGTVRAWGQNAWGQCDVPAGIGPAAWVAAGYQHAVAVLSNGTLRAWGDNFAGQATPIGGSGFVRAAAGAYHSVALRSDGTFACWGAGTTASGIFPNFGQSIVPAGLTGISRVAAGFFHTMALRTNGTVACLGAGGASDIPGIDPHFGQSIVPSGLAGVSEIAAGGYHSVALRTNGTVACWGRNDSGQSTVPAGLSGVVAIAAGGNTDLAHTVALLSDGSVRCWGDDSFGQSSVPTGLRNVSAIAAGGYFTLAVLTPAASDCADTAGAGTAVVGTNGGSWQDIRVWDWIVGGGPRVPGGQTNVDLGIYGSVGSECDARAATFMSYGGSSLLVPVDLSLPSGAQDHSIAVGSTATLAGRVWLLGSGASVLPADLDIPVLGATSVVGTFDVVQTNVPAPAGKFLALVPVPTLAGTEYRLRLLDLPGSGALSGASAGPFAGLAVAAETMDYDGDGFDDLAIAIDFGPSQPGTLQVLLNDGTGNLGLVSVQAATLAQPTCLATGDVDCDGRADAVVGTVSGSAAQVFLNNAPGSPAFSPGAQILPGSTPRSVVVMEGCASLLPLATNVAVGTSTGTAGPAMSFANGTTGAVVQVVQLSAGATTTTTVPSTGGRRIATGGTSTSTFEGESLVAVEPGKVLVLSESSTGSWGVAQSIPVPGKPVSVDAADMDGDGKPEIVTANAEPVLQGSGSALPVLTLFRGSATGFGNAVPIAPAGASSGLDVSLVDIDGDGDRDLVSVQRGIGTDSTAVSIRIDTAGPGGALALGTETDLGADTPILCDRGNLDGTGGEDLYLVDDSGTSLLGTTAAARSYLGADTAPACPADLTGDGSVDGQDLGLLLSSWNGDGAADLNGDGSVDGVDLGLMLSAWGACAAD